MKAILTLLAGILLTSATVAQNSDEPNQPGVSEEVLKAIEEFNRRKQNSEQKDNEVVVVLDPPAETTPAGKPGDKPVLVTGKPPAPSKESDPAEDFSDVDPFAEIEAQEPELLISEKVSPPPVPAEEPSLEVRVEAIKDSGMEIDPSKVTLKASFPAKPLSEAPEGWVLEKSEEAPLFEKKVELRPGSAITLSIRPHILTPAADGIETFAVNEPGFDPAQGYRQSQTVGSILGASVSQLDRDAVQLGNAISELHRLLASLPKAEEPEAP